MSSDRIRVVLADDHLVVRTGLKAVLAGAADIEVVGEAANGAEAVALAEKLRPDVIVMDLTMGDSDGATATREITQKGLPTRVLVLTMHAEEDYLVPLIEAGAAGYLVKSVADRELVSAVRAVAHGDTYLQPTAARLLARGLSKKADPRDERIAPFEKLTAREREVFKYIAQGFSAPEIGEKLSISPKTVDTYKQRIQEKIGLAHRTEYVQLALRLGLLTS